jgi:hypothetical protein
MNKIKDKLQQRAKFNKGKRVGYAKGRPVVDRETGEVLENFKPAPKPTPAPTPAPTPEPAPAAPANQRGNSGNVIPDYMRSSNQMSNNHRCQIYRLHQKEN